MRLAKDASDEVRRRVQNQTLGHRGHKHDPLYRARKLLVSASEQITDNGHTKPRGLLDAGDPCGEVRDAWHARETLRQHSHTDLIRSIRVDSRSALNAAGRGAPAGAWHAMAVTAATDPDTSRPDTSPQAPAEGVFSVSVVVSGVRCFLAYVLFPWGLPAAGIASGVGSGLGLAIGAVAIVFNGLSIRRFQRAEHRWRWPITALNGGIIVLLAILMVIDLNGLFG